MKVKSRVVEKETDNFSTEKRLKLPTLCKYYEHFPLPESKHFKSRNPVENRSVSIEPAALSSTGNRMEPQLYNNMVGNGVPKFLTK